MKLFVLDIVVWAGGRVAVWGYSGPGQAAPAGNETTYTSHCPDSSEAYAIHRPSGEKKGFRAFCVPARGTGSSWSSLRLNS